MFKILKYNLKESLKYMTIILSVAIILFTLVFFLFKANRVAEEGALVLYGFISFGVYLTTFIYVINAYKNDLYQERAYLTFTLPLKGWEVLGSKMILSIILFIISGVMCFLAFLFLIMNIGELRIIEFLKITNVKLSLPDTAFLIFLVSSLLVQWLQFILTIFFSINLSKVAIKNKQVGFISFVIFMIINFLIGFIGNEFAELIPYRINFYNGQIVEQSLATKGIFMNVGFFIYSIIVVVVIFGVTSYLLEKKVDL